MVSNDEEYKNAKKYNELMLINITFKEGQLYLIVIL
jgi:hypothetical protein